MAIALHRGQHVGVAEVLTPRLQLLGAELESVGKLGQSVSDRVRLEIH